MPHVIRMKQKADGEWGLNCIFVCTGSVLNFVCARVGGRGMGGGESGGGVGGNPA